MPASDATVLKCCRSDVAMLRGKIEHLQWQAELGTPQERKAARGEIGRCRRRIGELEEVINHVAPPPGR